LPSNCNHPSEQKRAPSLRGPESPTPGNRSVTRNDRPTVIQSRERIARVRGNRSHAAANQSENQPELYTTSPNGKPRCEAARSHFSHSMLIVLRLSRSKYFSIIRRKRRRTTRSMTLPFNYVAFTLTFAVIFRIELYSTWNMNTKGLNRTYRLKTTIRYDELRLRHAAWCRYIWGQSSHTHLGSLH